MHTIGPMHIIGLVGGIASGKSAVAAELAKLGAVVLDADKAAHTAINLPQVKQQLVARWGEQILASAGDVDRQAVAGIVFGAGASSRAELDYLESLLHPLIRDDFQQQLVQIGAEGHVAAVIDAPLLLEAGWGKLCDSIVLVESSEDDRSERIKSRNWSPEDLARRENLQMPIEEKRRLATYTIGNSGSLGELAVPVAEFWKEVVQ